MAEASTSPLSAADPLGDALREQASSAVPHPPASPAPPSLAGTKRSAEHEPEQDPPTQGEEEDVADEEAVTPPPAKKAKVPKKKATARPSTKAKPRTPKTPKTPKAQTIVEDEASDIELPDAEESDDAPALLTDAPAKRGPGRPKGFRPPKKEAGKTRKPIKPTRVSKRDAPQTDFFVPDTKAEGRQGQHKIKGPKSRGRPRKEVVVTSKASFTKPRGRPRKVGVSGTPMSKPGRGRPKKTVGAVAQSPGKKLGRPKGSVAVKGTPPKPRGRPKGSGVVAKGTPSKPRGRPKSVTVRTTPFKSRGTPSRPRGRPKKTAAASKK